MAEANIIRGYLFNMSGRPIFFANKWYDWLGMVVICSDDVCLVMVGLAAAMDVRL